MVPACRLSLPANRRRQEWRPGRWIVRQQRASADTRANICSTGTINPPGIFHTHMTKAESSAKSADVQAAGWSRTWLCVVNTTIVSDASRSVRSEFARNILTFLLERYGEERRQEGRNVRSGWTCCELPDAGRKSLIDTAGLCFLSRFLSHRCSPTEHYFRAVNLQL